MKRKNQINESKTLIKNALYRLLENNKFDEISLTEIANEAGVVRMTLYRHFKAKEDILLYGFEELTKEALCEIQMNKDIKFIDLIEMRLIILKSSREAQLLMENDYINQLFKSFRTNLLANMTKPLLDTSNDIRLFINGGVDAISKHWFETGMIESPKSVANRMNLIINRLIEKK
jgi:AcrR family transcriptional regulator